ncbi:hypothetical protein MK280_17735 [Myxococcota bacterium]|nr:hypothetical protein [Myxococcota bacterium]
MKNQIRRWVATEAENRSWSILSSAVLGITTRGRGVHRSACLLAGVGFALSITLACGSNPDANFIDLANQICGDGNTQMAKVQDALSREQGGLTAERQRLFVLETFVPGVERQLEAIWGLEMTAETRAGVARMQLAAQAALQELKKQPSLLFQSTGDQSLFAGVDQAARALGLNQCRANPVS